MVPIEYLLHFIEEDAPFGDATSDAIIPDITCNAVIRSEEPGIIAGLEEASALFAHYGIQIKSDVVDGVLVKRGDLLLSLCGNAKKILLVERTALNIIGRMSGIATRTHQMASVIREVNPRCRVAGTRKTCPGFRALDKKAVVLGGGESHRSSLSDGILIKDNHLVLVPFADAVRAAKNATWYKKIEIEVETCKDALVAAKAGADIIMLDNMSPDHIRKTLAALTNEGLRDVVTIELSGGINGENIKDYAALGADVISLGALTHTVRNFSVNLEILT
ncbi:MAG: carboxylating nicotinate-nucleotide diphosphorylase [Methanoregula sp.]|jgi:nicotinate-nucleotide pyrophosphorylase (carboxylating)